MTSEEMLDRADVLLGIYPGRLLDAVAAIIAKLDALDGRGADTDDMLDDIRATLAEVLSP